MDASKSETQSALSYAITVNRLPSLVHVGCMTVAFASGRISLR